MGRLIDADSVKDFFFSETSGTEETIRDLAEKHNLTYLNDVNEDEVMSFSKDLLEAVQNVIETEPTAYDPDKIVEQLEERTTFLKECTKYGNKDAEQQEKSYATMMMYEVAYLVDDLLEIVKGGGVDGN